MKVKSTVTLNMSRIRQLTQAAVMALEQTAEAVHTEVVQAQVMPRDTGVMQNESTFVNYSESSKGKVTIVTNTPYARRLYYHPEYHFQKTENPNARGKWYTDWMAGGKHENYAPKAFKAFYRKAGGL